jgi:hypothetical protein
LNHVFFSYACAPQPKSELLSSGEEKQNCVWYNIENARTFPEVTIYHYRYPDEGFNCRKSERPVRRDKKPKNSGCRKLYLTATVNRQSLERILTAAESVQRSKRENVTMRFVRADHGHSNHGHQIMGFNVQLATAPPGGQRRPASGDETTNRRRRHGGRRLNGRPASDAASRSHSDGAAAAAVADSDKSSSSSSSSLSRQTEFRPVDDVDAS